VSASRARLATAAVLPLIVAATLYLAALLDPWTVWLLGRTLGPLIEALDTAVVINIYMMLVYYIPAFVDGMADRDHSRAWRLICGIDVGWSGTLLIFSNLAYLYLTQERNVLRDSPASPTVRLLYLALILAGTTFHLATGIQARWGWWRIFVVWSLGVAALVLGLTAAEALGWLPTLTSLPPLALAPLVAPGRP
jgi:hypothetical protein